jgi:hypothetical protein
LGLTLSIINNSDKAYANYYSLKSDFEGTVVTRNLALSNVLKSYKSGDPAVLQKAITINASLQKFFKSKKESDLDSDFSRELKILIGNQNISDYLLASGINVKKLMRRVSNSSLLTITPTIKYNFNKGAPEALTYKADWQFGIRNDINKKPWQVEFAGIAKTERDTTNSFSNLDHISATGSGGINFVLKEDEKFKSQLEVKHYFEYTRIFQNRYTKEDANVYTANITA